MTLGIRAVSTNGGIAAPSEAYSRAMSAANPGETQSERARAAMVAVQLERRGIRDQAVLVAMRDVPREQFVDAPLGDAYADAALPIEAGQTISQPYIVARMTELLEVGPGARVLDVGTGSGYQAAVLATLGCRVTSIERHDSLAASARQRLARLGYGDRIEIVVGDGSRGWPSGAPWDGILVAAAAPSVPLSMRGQLGLRRRLVVPVGSREHQELLVVERIGEGEWTERSDGPCVFVPLLGAEGFRE